MTVPVLADTVWMDTKTHVKLSFRCHNINLPKMLTSVSISHPLLYFLKSSRSENGQQC